MPGDFDFDTDPIPAGRGKPSRKDPAAKPRPAPEPEDEPDEPPPPPRPAPRPQPAPRPAPAQPRAAGPADDFAFAAPPPAGPKAKARPAPRPEEPEEPPPPRPAPKKPKPRAELPPAPVAAAGPAADFSFDTGPAAPPDDEEDAPPPRSRRGREEERDERPSSKSRYGAKAKTEKGPRSPLVYMGLGAGGVALIAGIVIAILLTNKGKEAEVAKDKDKGKTAPPVAVVPAEKKKEPEPAADFMTAEVRQKVKRSTVYIKCLFNSGNGGSGSGFVEKETKYVVTNAHVLGFKTDMEKERDRRRKKPPEKTEAKDKEAGGKEKAKGKDKKGPAEAGEPDDRGPRAIQLTFNSGEGDKEVSVPGNLVAYDTERDLAVIAPVRVAGDAALVVDGLVVPKTTKVVELQKLFVFGFPLGESLGKEISIADVSVTSIRKGGDGRLPMIQVKGGMTRGNSGGPIVDGKGNVVGVSVAGYDGTDINLAIPGDAIHEFFKKNKVE